LSLELSLCCVQRGLDTRQYPPHPLSNKRQRYRENDEDDVADCIVVVTSGDSQKADVGESPSSKTPPSPITFQLEETEIPAQANSRSPISTIPDASGRSPLNSSGKEYYQDPNTSQAEVRPHPACSLIPDGPAPITAASIEQQLNCNRSACHEAELRSSIRSPTPSLDAVSIQSLRPLLVVRSPHSSAEPNELDIQHDIEMPRTGPESPSPVSPVPAEPTLAIVECTLPWSCHVASMPQDSQAGNALHHERRILEDADGPAETAVTLPVSQSCPQQDVMPSNQSNRGLSATPKSPPSQLAFSGEKNRDEAVELQTGCPYRFQNTELKSLPQSPGSISLPRDMGSVPPPQYRGSVSHLALAATNTMGGTAPNHQATGHPHPSNLGHLISLPEDSANARPTTSGIEILAVKTVHPIMPQNLPRRDEISVAMIDIIEGRKDRYNRPGSSSSITLKGRSRSYPASISSPPSVPPDGPTFMERGHPLNPPSTRSVSDENTSRNTSRQTVDRNSTAGKRIEDSPSLSSIQNVSTRIVPLSLSELLNLSPPPQLASESPSTHRRTYKGIPTSPSTPSRREPGRIRALLTDEVYPPPVTFTDSKCAQSDLPRKVLDAVMASFNMIARISIVSGPARKRSGSKQPKLFPIRTIMCCEVGDFYKWYSQVSPGSNGVPLRFELPDLTCQKGIGFTIAENQPKSFGLLKQYIWDAFWTESHRRETLALFRVTVKLPRLDYPCQHGNRSPPTPRAPATACQSLPVRSTDVSKSKPPQPHTMPSGEQVRGAFNTAAKNDTDGLEWPSCIYREMRFHI
jgi:hypothetical protein